MMSQMGTIAALCIISAILSTLLKKNSSEMALLLALAAAVSVLFMLRAALEEVLGFIGDMLAAAEISPALFAPLGKIAAIALLSRISAALCRDAGESALATTLEIAGALLAVLVSLPLFDAVWEMLRGLI